MSNITTFWHNIPIIYKIANSMSSASYRLAHGENLKMYRSQSCYIDDVHHSHNHKPYPNHKLTLTLTLTPNKCPRCGLWTRINRASVSVAWTCINLVTRSVVWTHQSWCGSVTTVDYLYCRVTIKSTKMEFCSC